MSASAASTVSYTFITWSSAATRNTYATLSWTAATHNRLPRLRNLLNVRQTPAHTMNAAPGPRV
ncbi:hypothetical protein ACQP2X_48980 [Actinoplanes sp. CA-131856]